MHFGLMLTIRQLFRKDESSAKGGCNGWMNELIGASSRTCSSRFLLHLIPIMLLEKTGDAEEDELREETSSSTCFNQIQKRKKDYNIIGTIKNWKREVKQSCIDTSPSLQNNV